MVALVASFLYVIVPVADMREKPTRDSEVVSQVYFSESVQIVEDQGKWVKIKNEIDGYLGWVEKESLYQRKDSYVAGVGKTIAKVSRLRVHLYDKQDTVFGPLLTLPFESKLLVLDPEDPSSTSRWIKVSLPNGREGFIQRGDVDLHSKLLTKDEMCCLSQKFLELPYTWGGRSSFGYDCSGFVQMLYSQMGVLLPRDAREQIKSPLLEEVTLEHLQPGDLIFFGLDAEKIRHVGMYLGKDLFIHSTVAENLPFIRMSQLSAPEWSGSGKYPYRALRTLR